MSGSGTATGARGINITNGTVAVNSTSNDPWGMINTKFGRRVFQARIRLSF
jgi:hypothetical protein